MIFSKYANRWSNLLWDCSISLVSTDRMRYRLFSLFITSSLNYIIPSMRLLLVTNNDSAFFSHLFSLFYSFRSYTPCYPQIASLFGISSFLITTSCDLNQMNEEKLVRSFCFFRFWNVLSSSHTEITTFMKKITRAIQGFLDERRKINNRECLFLLMKCIDYVYEVSGYCCEVKYPTNRQRVRHVVHQLRELMTLINTQITMNEFHYRLMIDLWRSVPDIGNVGLE